MRLTLTVILAAFLLAACGQTLSPEVSDVTSNAEAVCDGGAMVTTPIIKACKKCGQPSKYVATLPHGGGYGIYQCLDCKSVEWVPLKLVERGPMRNAERQYDSHPQRERG
jgi:predicted small secreted protein